MRAALTSLLVLAALLAGCLGGGDDDGRMLHDGSTDDGTRDGGGGDVHATDDDTLDGSQPFKPETHTWDGVIPIHACIGPDAGGTCVTSPASEDDDSNTFEVSEGASLASFEFTWDGGGELMVHVGGDPTVAEGEYLGTPRLQFEVPLDDPGTLTVSVSDETSQSTGHLQGNEWEFHMELTVS